MARRMDGKEPVPVKLCSSAACPEPAIYRGRCAEHARQTNYSTHRNRALYNSKRWKLLRRSVLLAQPLCACGCGRLSEDVDHIVPIEQGGAEWDRTNLQGLAHSCHAKKTRQEMSNA